MQGNGQFPFPCNHYHENSSNHVIKLTEHIDDRLIPQQAGFRQGKSCTSQATNLIQHIEDGFEKKKITGAVFVDLTAAYDTVNHHLLCKKVYDITQDHNFTTIIKSMLSNRMFYVTHMGKSSRWRRQKNGLPQGSVLAPILFNIYTNDQPIGDQTRHFLYADDLAATAQGDTHIEVQEMLQETLNKLQTYYVDNALRPNPSKTQVCSFHLKNAKAKCTLKLVWGGVQLENCENPKYLGITLDRTLTYKRHCENTKMKVEARNNLLRKLVSTRWGAKPKTLRTTAMALCYSTAEYGCAAWGRSAHVKKIDVALNNTMRIVSGCLRPTSVKHLPRICGIAPPGIRRCVAADVERTKKEQDPRHVMFNQKEVTPRLKSRRSFMKETHEMKVDPVEEREKRWSDLEKTTCYENLANGHELPYVEWLTLNRIRAGCARTAVNLTRWGIQDDVKCPDCGQKQTDDHLLVCGTGTAYTREELWGEMNNRTEGLVQRWKGRI
ncbi:unnamed protein product [Allacma fusca]|uniref:Reverse transcriptase domain-containing protein n=1 Tax=Allacma fusca TaxID=39272 RepID=A0A8J2KJQ0_9HEXA|nr:unnamed protein product [Allacma fusca]